MAEPTIGQLAFPVAVYSVARWSPRWQGVGALFVGYIGAFVASARWLIGFGGDLSTAALLPYVITIGAIVTAAWALGFAGQQRERYVAGLVERAEQAERMAEREVELAARDERSRIAREMHDVVAHSLSVMIALADGAGAAIDRSPASAHAAVDRVAETGRAALADMRRVLGVLSDSDATFSPPPGGTDLDRLVQSYRAAGLPVTLTVSGASLPADVGLQLSVYRIVQESLTNALRHSSGAGPATVELARERGGVRIVVASPLAAPATRQTRPGGRGIIGMRERAAIYGGSVDAGPSAASWRVRADLHWDEGDA